MVITTVVVVVVVDWHDLLAASVAVIDVSALFALALDEVAALVGVVEALVVW